MTTSQSLYEPSFEKDSCGIGVVARLDGVPCHETVRLCAETLANLDHRSAACEDTGGDGAGAVFALPDRFFRKFCDLPFELPKLGDYAAGSVFLPRSPQDQYIARSSIEHIARIFGLRVIGWRDVPVNLDVLPPSCRQAVPAVSQLFVVRATPSGGSPPSAKGILLGPNEQQKVREDRVFDLLLCAMRKAATKYARVALNVGDDAEKEAAEEFGGTSYLDEYSPFDLKVARSRGLDVAMSQSKDPDVWHDAQRAGRDNDSSAVAPDDIGYFLSLSRNVLIYKGMLTCSQLFAFYPDLLNPSFQSHFAITHSRFSTNTFPCWARAQPLRLLSQNGEINTLRGNAATMRAREGVLRIPKEFADPVQTDSEGSPPVWLPYKEYYRNAILDESKATIGGVPVQLVRRALMPVIEPRGSDSAALDNAMELLMFVGMMSPEHAMSFLVPPALPTEAVSDEDATVEAYVRFNSLVQEPWDGPALLAWTNGHMLGTSLDRNGLRPCRWAVTRDGFFLAGSELGSIRSVPLENIEKIGRVQPGYSVTVNLHTGLVLSGREQVYQLAQRFPYRQILDATAIPLLRLMQDKELESKYLAVRQEGFRFTALPNATHNVVIPADRDPRAVCFGFTLEHLFVILAPMADTGDEPLGSMGNDSELAALGHTTRPRPLASFFMQLFAQVTNPPIDPLREAAFMTTQCAIGPSTNLLTMHSDLAEDVTENKVKRLILEEPILSDNGLDCILFQDIWKVRVIDMTVPIAEKFSDNRDVVNLESALNGIIRQVVGCIAGEKADFIIFQDHNVGLGRAPIPSLLVIGAVHQALVQRGLRTRASLIVSGGDIREVHDLAVLLGFGADAVHPWMSYRMIRNLPLRYRNTRSKDQTPQTAAALYRHALRKGLLKVLGKMGISCLSSYKGAGVFEAIGLGKDVIDKCFSGTPSRVSGLALSDLATGIAHQYHDAYIRKRTMTDPGEFNWRPGADADAHSWTPEAIAALQDSVRLLKPPLNELESPVPSPGVAGLIERVEHSLQEALHVLKKTPIAPEAAADTEEAMANYSKFKEHVNKAVGKTCLRGLLSFRSNIATPIPLEEVEPHIDIMRRFVTGAMSFGSISAEAHKTIAIAMNRIGSKSNCGEGGEDPQRLLSRPRPPPGTVLQDDDSAIAAVTVVEAGPLAGRSSVMQLASSLGGDMASGMDSERSAIRQVASGRFGVTAHYLSHADTVQIKLAQGAKPGEGGELPGHKVSETIARTRHATPGVGLISPPPHHDIYSIEDLAQLIHDLKAVAPEAAISVKLVSEVGVGIIAAGVAKANADHIVVSGHDGGTGAAKWTALKHAGSPWEMGLAETHTVLVMNNLRHRVTLQVDGGLRTGRDVVIAALLGGEEFGFGTVPLVALGCVMMRKCHLNTCPVGIATQNPILRKKFTGKPEHVINYFWAVADDVRQIMAALGFRRFIDMVGRSEFLVQSDTQHTPGVVTSTSIDPALGGRFDLSRMLQPARQARPDVGQLHTTANAPVDMVLDQKWIQVLQLRDYEKLGIPKPITVLQGKSVGLTSTSPLPITTTHRSVGCRLSNFVVLNYGENGLSPPFSPLVVYLRGYAGQSFGGFLAKGVTLSLVGATNDYAGKGLSGGTIAVRGPQSWELPAVGCFLPVGPVLVGNVCLFGATSGNFFVAGSTGTRFAVRNSGARAVVEGSAEHCCQYMTGGRVVVLGPLQGANAGSGMSGGVAWIYMKDDEERVRKNICTTTLSVDSVEPSMPHGGGIGAEAVGSADELLALIQEHFAATESPAAKVVIDAWPESASWFIRLFPKDYRKCLMKSEDVVLRSPLPGGLQPNVDNKIEPTGAGRDGDIEDLGLMSREMFERTKINGFMMFDRMADAYRPPTVRAGDWKEMQVPSTQFNTKRMEDAARCMDCGVPFCQSDHGCPIANKIPEVNSLVYDNRWHDAYLRLDETNNFPEFTGRACPAPCEGACVLGVIDKPVTIKNIENAVIDRAWEEGWVVPRKNMILEPVRTVGIIGSGPAGLAAANELVRLGRKVIVYERQAAAGGLLRYGIPPAKLSKSVIQRRIDFLKAEGVDFQLNCDVDGPSGPTSAELRAKHDAVIVCVGACAARDVPVPGRKLKNVMFAMEYLTAQQEALDKAQQSGRTANSVTSRINAQGKNVVVIGTGDTGTDCIGTAVRQGAKSVKNFALMERPSDERIEDVNPWPQYPQVFKVDYAHEEAGEDPRVYERLTEEFLPSATDPTSVGAVRTKKVRWVTKSGVHGVRGRMRKYKVIETVPDSEEAWEADLVILAVGYTGLEQYVAEALKCDVSAGASSVSASRAKADDSSAVFGSIVADTKNYMTSEKGVFAAGDCRKGQSLIVWAIHEGRDVAHAVDRYFTAQDQSNSVVGVWKTPTTKA